MEGFAPLILLFLVWSLIIAPLTAAKKKAVQNQQKRQSQAFREAAENTPAQAPKQAPAPVRQTPAPTLQARTTLQTSPMASRLKEPYQGSLGGESTEGTDPCHDEQLAGLDRIESTEQITDPGAGKPGLSLSWSSNDVVKGFVYGEILNRR